MDTYHDQRASSLTLDSGKLEGIPGVKKERLDEAMKVRRDLSLSSSITSPIFTLQFLVHVLLNTSYSCSDL